MAHYLNPKILLIVPAYNEGAGIASVISKVVAYIDQSNAHIDYVVINDGSTDNEEEVLQEHHINHIELIQNLGIGGAVQTGYRYALQNHYDIAVQFDGDGQHDLDSLSALLDPIVKGEADFSVGSRFIKESPSAFKSTFVRRRGIKLLSKAVYQTSGIKIEDITSGYRAGNRKVIELFAHDYPKRNPEPESYLQFIGRDIRVKEVGAKMFERETGRSSISFWSGTKYVLSVLSSLFIDRLTTKEE